jgi:hypothetical protein
MKRGLVVAPAAVCAALIVWSVGVRGAKPVRDQKASVTFRCVATVPDSVCPSAASLPDGIRGDGETYEGVLNANGELRLQLAAGSGRTIWLDFRNGGDPSCPTCRRDFDTLFLDDVIVQTNVVDASGAEVPNGLKAIPVGGTSDARVKVGWNRLNYLGQTVQWAIRFNPEFYPGSDHVTVHRVSTTTWEIEAFPSDRALLPSNIFRKKQTDQQEGPFFMPFKIIVVSPVP